MKIHWYDRLLLIIVALLLLAMAVLIAMLALGIGSDGAPEIVRLLLGHNINRILLCVGALLLFLMGLRLFFVRTKGAKRLSTIFMQTTDAGTIRITVEAIEALVQRTARTIPQVRDVKCSVHGGEDHQVSIGLRTILEPEALIKEVSAALQSSIKEALQTNLGVTVGEVLVTVEALPAPAAALRVE